MSIFNKKGMMVFPNPLQKQKICAEEELVVFTECYCPKGHNLVREEAQFNDFNGIYLKIAKEGQEGFVALSPVYGCKNKVSVGIKLKKGMRYELRCPECDTVLPSFSKCHCEGDIITLFLNKKADFHSFIGACNRIGCENSYIQIGKELITTIRQEAL